MTLLEALQYVLREMEQTYEAAEAKKSKGRTKIDAFTFNGHRRDLLAILQRLERVGGDANQDLKGPS